jgi:nucleotide-binding universal stress UspA family protein
MSLIVVGIDGSQSAETALRFALEEARLRGATLRIVTVWSTPSTVYTGMVYVPTFDLREVEEQAASERLEAARALVGDTPGVTIETVSVEGQTAGALVAEAAGADLLVVGSRGHGGFTNLLLGSVSQQVAHHAKVPLAIVRASPSEPGK